MGMVYEDVTNKKAVELLEKLDAAIADMTQWKEHWDETDKTEHVVFCAKANALSDGLLNEVNDYISALPVDAIFSTRRGSSLYASDTAILTSRLNTLVALDYKLRVMREADGNICVVEHNMEDTEVSA